MLEQALMLAGVACVAFLYASVGHGGASGYLAVLALFGFAIVQMKSSALVLNLLIAAVSFWAFQRARHFEWKLFWPFAVTSVPFSFIGGFLTLSPKVYGLLLAGTLLYASVRLALARSGAETAWTGPRLPVALGAGAGIGLLSGMVGVGGGIFLSPLMILMDWADAKRVAAVSALFIWVNSLAGLAGYIAKGGSLPPWQWSLALAALAGGFAGAHLGANRFESPTLKRLLAVVLLLAGWKLLKVSL